MSKKNKHLAKAIQVEPADVVLEQPADIVVTEPLKAKEENVIKVIVDGREITVHEGTFVMALRKEGIRKQMIEQLPQLLHQYNYGVEEQTALIMFYPPMTACSSCEKMFTPKEFLALKELEIDGWYGAVNKLNPHWFPKPPELEDEKKKES